MSYRQVSEKKEVCVETTVIACDGCDRQVDWGWSRNTEPKSAYAGWFALMAYGDDGIASISKARHFCPECGAKRFA